MCTLRKKGNDMSSDKLFLEIVTIARLAIIFDNQNKEYCSEINEYGNPV